MTQFRFCITVLSYSYVQAGGALCQSALLALHYSDRAVLGGFLLPTLALGNWNGAYKG
jgi:hypothetical protein